MERMLFVLPVVLVAATAVFGQPGRAGQENSLRGLKGVRFEVIVFARAEAVDEAERAAILKLVEADAIAKLQKAGIPLLRYGKEIEDAGSPRLLVYITCDKPNGFVYPLVTNIRLLQRVRLARDPSIEADLPTWEQSGVGAPKVSVEMIRSQVATEIDQFIKDYKTVNLASARR